MDLSLVIAAASGAARHFRVYLREAADQPLVAAILQEQLFADTDRISCVQADICRTALQVEMEASLFGITAFRR